LTKQTGPPFHTTAGTYRTAPSHGFEGREAIFLKGLPNSDGKKIISEEDFFSWDKVDTNSDEGSE
jgi:hypothetical protein